MQNINFKDFVKEIFENEGKLSSAYSAFHRYSLANCWLAMKQTGNLEPINTYKGWQKLGRQVKKGSKAIELMMPITCKRKFEDKNGEEAEATFQRFIYRKNWFSLSQTEGEEYSPEPFNGFCVEKAMAELKINREKFSHHSGNCQGYAIPSEKVIAINPVAYNPFKTTIHEIAHCLMHDSEQAHDSAALPICEKELEAEGVAYMVCAALNKRDGLEYSRGYIQHWIKRDDVAQKHFRRIMATANKILQAGRQ